MLLYYCQSKIKSLTFTFYVYWHKSQNLKKWPPFAGYNRASWRREPLAHSTACKTCTKKFMVNFVSISKYLKKRWPIIFSSSCSDFDNSWKIAVDGVTANMVWQIKVCDLLFLQKWCLFQTLSRIEAKANVSNISGYF